MKANCLFLPLILISAFSMGQFKNDNVLYKTIYPQDLCKELQQSKGYLILDVRSKGEFADTSSFPVYNLGHLENAMNIDVSELPKRLSEISDYKDKRIYVYCSHSQRSRRSSKMLADSGFTNVINVNGGFSAIRRLAEDNCIKNLIKTTVGYNILSVAQLCTKLNETAKPFLLDVRSDSAFKHIDLRANVNAMGNFKNAINIPLADLIKRLTEIPQNKEIIIIDVSGDQAAEAANLLYNNNFRNISILLEGVERMFHSDSKDLACINDKYLSPVKYKIISSVDLKRLKETSPDFLPLDIRSSEEFNNKHKDTYRNIGHLVNAINVPLAKLLAGTAEIVQYKNKPVLIYAFTGGKDPHEAAQMLMNRGFTNVMVLSGGLFNVRWTSGNVYGYTSLMNFVEDVPAENL
ncbi:MAG: rhodanese-like domain-containing protein [Ferruginibacter sp.]